MSVEPSLEARIEALFEQLTKQQHQKVLDHARRNNPRLTDDDITQPHDFSELANDPAWNYEDGVLAGYRSAQMAVRALVRRSER